MDTERTVRFTVDGEVIVGDARAILASAMVSHRLTNFRDSVLGEPRAPLCGMGVCYECRVTIDGVPHQRACMILVRDGMVVETGG